MSPQSAHFDWGERPRERIEQRIILKRDGSIIAKSGKVEYGQGIRTGFAKIVADELDVPIDRIHVELGETDRVPWDMGTFGSLSTATDGQSLRVAAAYARMLLVERAGNQLGIATNLLEIRNGTVLAPDGRSIPYEELISDRPLTGPILEEKITLRAHLPVLSDPLRLEALDIVTGAARYPGDIRLPGMLRGHVLHPSVAGAKLIALNDIAARSSPGIIAILREEDFVGIIAERDDQAISALRMLEATWHNPVVPPVSKVELILRRDSNVEAAFSKADRIIRARYKVPHIAHASISPSVAVADVHQDSADLYVATQRPFPLREEVAEFLGIAQDRVRVHPQMMTGLFGRGNMNDAVMDAVRLSRAFSRPILVQWTREEEFTLSPHRPVLEAEIHGALDREGRIVGWRYRSRTNPHTYGSTIGPTQLTEITAGRNAVPPYRLDNAEVLLEVVPGSIRTGAFRSLAAAPNVFAIESFIDEIAYVLKLDPISFRVKHIEDGRLRKVLETVRERSGWEQRRREPGRGYGVSCTIYNNTYVAQVAEVTVLANGKVNLERVWCAVDAGRLVHPDGARNQIEGGIQQAASWTLLEELRHHNGEVTTTTWLDYPIATFHDAPRSIDVVFTCEEDAPSTGIGEPGSVPTAAAIANAVFDACGARVRDLPLNPLAVSKLRT